MKRELLGIDDMADAMLEREAKKRPSNAFYKAQSDEHRAEEISQNLDARLNLLKIAPVGNRGSIFHDLEAVKARTFGYFEACKQAGIIPTSIGLAGFGYGVSRQRMDDYLRNNPDSDTAEFIAVVKDAINADMLIDRSLANQINVIMSIFTLKNTAGMSDRLEIAPIAANAPLGQEMTKEQIARAVAELPDYDED